jgi:serine/threonine protein kinase
MRRLQELCPGGSIAGCLQRWQLQQPGSSSGQQQLLTSEFILYMLGQLASGVRHIHAARLLHRDLKSENIMATPLHGCPENTFNNLSLNMVMIKL